MNMQLLPSIAFAVLGIVIIVRTAALGASSPLASGYVFGFGLIVVAALRGYVAVRRRGGR